MISFATHIATSPTVDDAIRQVARWWTGVFNDLKADADTALVFVEPGAFMPGHVYAGPLPSVASGGRLRPACSMTVNPTPGPSSLNDRRTQVGIQCEARASTREEAMRMLLNLRRSIRPAPGYDAFVAPHTHNIIGLPALAPANGSTPVEVRAWRFLWIDIQAEPQPLTLPDLPGDEGEASAVMTLACAAVPAIVESVFTLRATNEALGEAGVDCSEGSLDLTRLPEGEAPVFASFDLKSLTIAQLIAAINADTLTHGFIAESPAPGATLAAPARDIVGFFTIELEPGSGGEDGTDRFVLGAWRH